MLDPEILKQSATYKAAVNSPLALNPAVAKFVTESLKDAVRDGIAQYRIDKIKDEAMKTGIADSHPKKVMEAIQHVQKSRAEAKGDTILLGDPVYGYQHLPLLDIDGDRFAANTYYRGAHWRGRDCRDLDSLMHPGRAKNPYGKNDDWNCNGIQGVHPTGVSWKDYVCKGSQQRGVGVIGDSAGAHFSIPAEWVTPGTINLQTYSNFLSVLSDEFDFPQNSAYTAYTESQPGALYPLKSVYKEVLKRNQCNFRDFQNLAVNGGDSYNVQTYQLSLSRNQTNDAPMLLFLELLGNDVCGPAHNFDEATPADVFKKNIYTILNKLDTQLPNGSHVAVLGLVDGRVLFDVLHDQPHPIGGGVTYANLYDFLNCVYCNPCWGWLNSNSSVRDAATAWAQNLNLQIKAIMAETGGKFKNFDLIYYDTPANEILDSWAAMGHPKAQLVEPVDGFHPNQYFLSMLSDWLVKHLESDKPDFLGPTNPNNDLITAVFGNQGGY
jgi:acyloxyacyl hydrolase